MPMAKKVFMVLKRLLGNKVLYKQKHLVSFAKNTFPSFNFIMFISLRNSSLSISVIIIILGEHNCMEYPCR